MMSPTARDIPWRTFPPLPSSLVHSSFIPSPAEETAIRETIHDIDTTLSSVDDEIARVRTTLSELEEYRSTLHIALENQQACLSPVRRLPPEILEEIFLFAASGCAIEWPRSPRQSSNVDQDDNDMPWSLCRICSYWRTVAISVPKLWSSIHLDLTMLSSSGIETAQSVLRLCLSRSKNELLTFSFGIEEFRVVALLPFLEPLLTQSKRWNNISLSPVILFYFRDYLSRVKNRMPNLQRLCLEASPSQGADSIGDLSSSRALEAFEDSVNLRELSMTHINHPSQNFRLPWSQITHFTSRGNTFREGEFTRIMQHMTNLVSFSTESERIIEVASTPPVLLPHLRKLSIHNKGSYISKTCQFLTVPNLEELSIHAITPFVAQHTIAMVARSQCKPTHLTFHSSLDVDEVWEENISVAWMLSELPSLTHLELTVVKSGQHILPQMVKPSRMFASALLPNLDSLVLEDRFCTSAAEIAEAFGSRIKNGVSPYLMRSITLRLFTPANSKFSELDWLKGIARDYGVEITTFSG